MHSCGGLSVRLIGTADLHGFSARGGCRPRSIDGLGYTRGSTDPGLPVSGRSTHAVVLELPETKPAASKLPIKVRRIASPASAENLATNSQCRRVKTSCLASVLDGRLAAATIIRTLTRVLTRVDLSLNEQETMDLETLFRRTVDDLDQRVAAIAHYDALMSAALLRKLLLDGNPLIHQVNRTYRLNLRFRISGVSQFEQMLLDSDPMFWSLEDGLDPDIGLAVPVVEATLDQFLARNVMRFEGRSVTVRDVINQLSNVDGGVHKGEPREDQQKVLAAAATFYSNRGLPGVVNQVRLIGRVASRGLRPLYDAVRAAQARTTKA